MNKIILEKGKNIGIGKNIGKGEQIEIGEKGEQIEIGEKVEQIEIGEIGENIGIGEIGEIGEIGGKGCYKLNNPLLHVIHSVHSVFPHSSYVEDKCLYVKAGSIQHYKEWKQRNHFTLEHLSNLLENVIEQTLTLQKFNCTSIGININDLYVVDDTYFFIFPSNNLYHINNNDNNNNDNDNRITIKLPPEKPFFTCPELLKIESLPFSLEIEYFYFMVGQLAIYCFFGKNILRANELMSEEEIEQILRPIKNTHYYWCIKQSIIKEGSKRELIFME